MQMDRELMLSGNAQFTSKVVTNNKKGEREMDNKSKFVRKTSQNPIIMLQCWLHCQEIFDTTGAELFASIIKQNFNVDVNDVKQLENFVNKLEKKEGKKHDKRTH